MEKEFIPYEQASALKELGFDEPCFGYYLAGGVRLKEYKDSKNKNSAFFNNTVCSIPLYQQAFRWFREKYNLCSWIYQSNSGLYHYSILEQDRYLTSGYNNQTSYEEAELECLKKLIEIVKKNN